MSSRYTLTGIAFAATLAATPVHAVTISFTGTRSNVDAAGPQSPRCGTRTTANIRHDPPTATSVGVSNLGAFTPTLSHCIQLPLSNLAANTFDLGEFSFDFGMGNVLLGTYSGVVNFVSPGRYSIEQTHLVTGGTGDFFQASGSFDSSGFLTFPGGRPNVTQTFSGTLSLPAVPEPATWLMLILGFGAVGAGLRSRERRTATARLASAE